MRIPRRPPPAAPPSSDEDIALFHASIGPVRRIVATPSALTSPKPLPEATQFLRDEARVRDELLDVPIDPAEMEVGEELSYLRDGYRPDLLKRLKRGAFSVQDDIDLHQMTGAVARTAIVEFIAEAKQRGLACVKLIHGKGLRSKPGGPVIKRLVDRMLRQRDDVIAFASARATSGGTGATVVLLRTDR
ncbi:MAG: Smr/MutS family protein [Tahibacter sp.]